jgi:plastocyanin
LGEKEEGVLAEQSTLTNYSEHLYNEDLAPKPVLRSRLSLVECAGSFLTFSNLLRFVTICEEVGSVGRRDLMNRLMYIIPLSAVTVLLLATPALTQTTPNDIEASPTQTTDAVQETGGAATDPTTVPAETTAPAESTTPAPNSTTTVDIHDHAFNPVQLNVAPGTTVTFVNNDTEPHTATANDGLFDSGVLEPGSSFDVWLDGSGTVRYHCELHPDMQGSIVVGEGGGAEGVNPPNQAVSVYP